MKCLLLADNRPKLTATLEPILKHWGYRVVSASKATEIVTFLKESAPCVLIIGEQLLAEQSLTRATSAQLPIIALQQDTDQPAAIPATETLAVPVDIFALFSFIQRKVEHHPRQNLRLRVQLPGMYRTRNDDYILADVLSLSTQGLFFKSSKRLQQGDDVSVVIPLLGRCRELEIESKVLYVIEPQADNNYMQGFGVGFGTIGDEDQASLENYIEDHLLSQISVHQNGVSDPSTLSTRN